MNYLQKKISFISLNEIWTRGYFYYQFSLQKTIITLTVLYPVKVTLKKLKISLYGLIAEVLRGEVISLAGKFDFVEVFNTLLNQVFQFCHGLMANSRQTMQEKLSNPSCHRILIDMMHISIYFEAGFCLLIAIKQL